MAESRALSDTVLILASSSPRRAELLTAAGIPFEIRPAHIDERVHPGEDAGRYVRRIAEGKAHVVADGAPGRAVLAADTAVVVDEQILGKPENASDAMRMLRLLSGRAHQVLTGVCLLAPAEARRHGPAEAGPCGTDTRLSCTQVEFAALSPEEIQWYVASGEPVDKAGAYAIQGLASRFVTRIEGSYSNVVGLPVAMVYEMCTRAGILLS
jgi:septum formation protein